MHTLQQEGTVNVQQLSGMLQVTPKTVRLDLQKLEKANLLQRVYGGAVLCRQPPANYIAIQDITQAEKKRILAQKALELLRSGDVILLDDGSTSLALAQLLGDFPITVLTNDIRIINELMSKTQVTLFVIGGPIKRDGISFVVVGDDAIQFVKKYRVNKTFIGASTVDIDNGLMIFHYGDRSTKRAFMSVADEVICMADSSKFGHTAFTRIADIQEIDTIITDRGVSEKEAESYSALGVQIIFAD